MPGGKVWMFGTRSLEAESSMLGSRGSCLIEMSCGMGGGRGRNWEDWYDGSRDWGVRRIGQNCEHSMRCCTM